LNRRPGLRDDSSDPTCGNRSCVVGFHVAAAQVTPNKIPWEKTQDRLGRNRFLLTDPQRAQGKSRDVSSPRWGLIRLRPSLETLRDDVGVPRRSLLQRSGAPDAASARRIHCVTGRAQGASERDECSGCGPGPRQLPIARSANTSRFVGWRWWRHRGGGCGGHARRCGSVTDGVGGDHVECVLRSVDKSGDHT
jgi:hypothetical protein